MKKLLGTSILMACLTLSVVTPVQSAKRPVVTAEDLELYYYKYFFYLSDDIQFDLRGFWRVDHFQSPQEFEKRKRGDCDDFAIHSAMVLRALGYSFVQMYVLQTPDGGHAITVYRDGNSYNIMSNGRIFYSKEKTPYDVINLAYSDWETISLFTPPKYGIINPIDVLRTREVLYNRR